MKDKISGKLKEIISEAVIEYADKKTEKEAKVKDQIKNIIMEAANSIKKIDFTPKIIGTMENPHHKAFDVEDVKIEKEGEFLIFEGYANTKNKADRYGDIPTVYSKVRDYVYDLKFYKKNPVLLLNHINQTDYIAGSMMKIFEDEKGLYFKAKISNSDYGPVKHFRTILQEGHAKAISIGGRWHYENVENTRQLTLAEIAEISAVGVGADPRALGAAGDQ